jgi:hypothetical protein
MSRTSRTFTIDGVKFRSASNRRWIVVRITPQPYNVEYGDGQSITVPAGASIIRRSDSLETARSVYEKNRDSLKNFHVLIDQPTGRTLTRRDGWSD